MSALKHTSLQQARGDEIYESQVRPKIEPGNYGQIVAIDLKNLSQCVDIVYTIF